MVYDGSQATLGPGFLLDYEDPEAPGDWLHVAEIKDITGPSETTKEHDVTNQDSVGGFAENMAGLQDGGTVTFDMNSVPSDEGQQALADLKHARTIVNWRILMGATGFYKHFAGFINALGNAFPVDGPMLRNIGIRVSGPVSETQVGS